MSAELVALAARAAAHYAGVRGPWLHPTTMVLEPDPTRPSWLIVRDSHPARTREALLFNPLPRKEIAPLETTASPPRPLPAKRLLDRRLNATLAIYDDTEIHVEKSPAKEFLPGEVSPAHAVVELDRGVRLVIWEPAAAFALAEALREVVEYFDRVAAEAEPS